MQDVSTFLFGKKVASQMQALKEQLRAIETKHQDYFAATRSKYAVQGEYKPATIDVEPSLRPDIAAECLACAHTVTMLPAPNTLSQELAAGFQTYVRRHFYRFARLRIRFARSYGGPLIIRAKPRSSDSAAI
jgi:hypothetical protein